MVDPTGVTIHAPLPDPFRLDNGRRVASLDDWQERREEIATRLLETQYGTMPDAPEARTASIGDWQVVDGERRQRVDRLEWTPIEAAPQHGFGVDITITLPAIEEIAARRRTCPTFDAKGLPVVLFVGRQRHEALLRRGYAIVNYPNDKIEPMHEGRPMLGPARAVYRRLYGDTFSWGSIAAWAWGARRVMDYLADVSELDAAATAISGHSRNGKTALLAGALDERFGVVNPAGSGCAGAGSYLVLGDGAEDLAALTDRRRWWAWTHPSFETWVGREPELAFDQHFLMALVARRPLLRTEGFDDAWANPIGTSATYLATQPVYDFLGVPAANAIAYRPGGHAQTEVDASHLASLCDEVFFGIERVERLDVVLPETPPRERFMGWRAPLAQST